MVDISECPGKFETFISSTSFPIKEIDMTYTYTGHNQADCTHYFYMGKEFREELYFDSLQSYFSFLIMKFFKQQASNGALWLLR